MVRVRVEVRGMLRVETYIIGAMVGVRMKFTVRVRVKVRGRVWACHVLDPLQVIQKDLRGGWGLRIQHAESSGGRGVGDEGIDE